MGSGRGFEVQDYCIVEKMLGEFPRDTSFKSWKGSGFTMVDYRLPHRAYTNSLDTYPFTTIDEFFGKN